MDIQSQLTKILSILDDLHVQEIPVEPVPEEKFSVRLWEDVFAQEDFATDFDMYLISTNALPEPTDFAQIVHEI